MYCVKNYNDGISWLYSRKERKKIKNTIFFLFICCCVCLLWFAGTEVRGQLWRYVALDVGAYGGARGSRTVLRARGCGAGLGETLGFLLRQRKERKKLTKSDSGNYG